MKHLNKLTIMAAVLFLTAGCVTTESGRWTDSRWNCTLAGAAAGGAIGATDDSDAAATGALIGGAVGAIFCGNRDSDGDGVKDGRDKCPGTPPGTAVDEFGCALDDDGDGVPNSEDRCPGTPAGVKVDATGCEPDSDGDGVPDRLDKCPNTPAGAKVDANGCELDSDGDGVVDSRDRCPGTAPGTPVDNEGCDLDTAYRLEGVTFEFDSARLTAGAKERLDDAVEILKRHSDLAVEIAGHTDSVGSAEYNQGLSQRRADSVRDYLVGKGANPAMLKTRGYGESEPVADNSTAAGRAQNRRVEFRHQGSTSAWPMTYLILGVLLWSVLHIVPAVPLPLRGRLVARTDLVVYKGAFSVLMVCAIGLMIFGWKSSSTELIFRPPRWGAGLAFWLMLAASVMLFAPYLRSNVSRLVRHPQLLGLVCACVGHVIASGQLRSLVLFGGIGAWSAIEIALLNRRDGPWTRPAPVPHAQDFRLGLVGLAFFLLFLFTHELLFGASPLPHWFGL
ncbi:MAG: NnrU family protein [Gammaproteobacteria bacterium]